MLSRCAALGGPIDPVYILNKAISGLSPRGSPTLRSSLTLPPISRCHPRTLFAPPRLSSYSTLSQCCYFFFSFLSIGRLILPQFTRRCFPPAFSSLSISVCLALSESEGETERELQSPWRHWSHWEWQSKENNEPSILLLRPSLGLFVVQRSFILVLWGRWHTLSPWLTHRHIWVKWN